MPNKKNNLIVGLTGGIASGKTTTACEFAKEGAVIIDADSISRRIVEPENPAWSKIVNNFGNKILQPDGFIDRKKLANIVFHDTSQRKILENITHPYIINEFNKEIKKYKNKIIIIDIPLLYETGLDKAVDKVIVVWVSEKIQIGRLKMRENLTLKDMKARIKAQLSLEFKKNKADFIIDNSFDLENMRQQVKKIWGVLTNYV